MKDVRSIAAALTRRGQRLRNRARLRQVRLHDFAPVPALVAAASEVPSAAVPAADVHNHLGRWLTGGRNWMVPDVGALLADMDRLGVASIVNLDGRWGAELTANLDRYDRAHPGRFATFCHLDWSLLQGRSGPDALVAGLRQSAAAGACGIKVWKDFGLSVRGADGRLVAVDDPRLADVWEVAGELGLPVLIHTADPMAFWQPVDRHNERLEELLEHPDWQHGSRPVPSHEALVGALGRLVAAHPGTTFIAAHLASCAEDLARVAGFLDAHPNLVVDLSAREAEIGRQPRAARALVEAYPDRVLWGTDAFPFDAARYRTWFRLLETEDEHFPYSTSAVPPQGRWAISGLALPADVLPSVYAGNARRLIPALAV
jgi:predicted TIM-barrel fold metal-dependent hydrolase